MSQSGAGASSSRKGLIHGIGDRKVDGSYPDHRYGSRVRQGLGLRPHRHRRKAGRSWI